MSGYPGREWLMRADDVAEKAENDAYAALNHAYTTGDRKAEAAAVRRRTAAKKEADAARAEYAGMGDQHARFMGAFGHREPHRFETGMHKGDPGDGAFAAKALPPLSAEQKRTIADSEAFVGGLTGPGRTPVRHARAAGGRAFCRDGYDYQTVAHDGAFSNPASQSRAKEIAVHELGHAIEHSRPGLAERAGRFRDYRLDGERPVSLAERFPDSKFEAHERGAKDNFDRVFDGHGAYYVGKEYGRATELISMGLEQLSRDPAKFAAKDPEYFHFVLWAIR